MESGSSVQCSMLIVEDDADVREALQGILRSKYPLFRLHLAANGRDGLEAFRNLGPDLVLTDIRMPGMSGLEMAQAIRQIAPQAPIIVITAQSDSTVLQDCIRINVMRYLVKPIDSGALFEAVDNCLKGIELERKVKIQHEELAENRELLRMVLESAHLGAWDYRLDTGKLFWDERCRSMVGLSAESRIDFRSSLECIHPEDRDRVDRAVWEAVAGCAGGIYHQEYRVIRPDGSLCWISSRGRVYFDDQGVSRFIGANQDITERKQAEAYRELSREVLQILNEPGEMQHSIRQLLAVVSKRTGFDAVGIRLQAGDDFPYLAQEGFSEDFLLTENTLLARTGAGGISPEQDPRDLLECACGLVISGKGDPGSPFFTPGGSFWTNDSARFLVDLPADLDPGFRPRNQCIHQGYGSFALVPIRNKERVIGLFQFNARRKGRFSPEAVELLEGMVAHIGAALMRKRAEEETLALEAQLQQAQKLESVGQLAGGVAHDFNNKLCVILGHVNLVLMDVDPSQPMRLNLEEIRRAAEQSADLTRQLLAFARKQTVVPRVLDLNQTVSGICQMLKRLIGESIDLRWHPAAELWQVKVDPSQIDQILTNLCVNSRDSIAERGEIVIRLENISVAGGSFGHHPEFAAGDYVLLVVSDSGCGMDKEMQGRIFEPFFTTKGVGEGTGLGLSSVYGAVKQNKGFITVYSVPGLGTTVTVYLPRYLGPCDPVQSEGAAAPVSRGHETVLLVEDEQAILDMTTIFLVRQGYKVLQAGTPEKAIRLAREYPGDLDLLVTDVVLPEMDGMELAGKLAPLHPKLRHLFMSGYPAGIIAHHGLLKEGLHFIHKPFALADLAAKVREVLDGE